MFVERRFQGMHTWDNAFLFSLEPSIMGASRRLNIIDAPAMILGCLGVEI